MSSKDESVLDGNRSTDWGKTGYLASIYEKEVYIWDPMDSDQRYRILKSNGCVENCLKWNRNGSRIAVGKQKKGLSIWDLHAKKLYAHAQCTCPRSCLITCIEWTHDNKRLVAGCSNGRLSSFTSSLKPEYVFYPAHVIHIVCMAFSQRDRFFASSSLDGVVRVWEWPRMVGYFEICVSTPVKNIVWHPWTESLLVTSHMQTLSLWNANTMTQLDCHVSDSICDGLAWSELTGELIVSLWNGYPEDVVGHEDNNKIQIMSNFNTVVDSIQWHQGRVPYLLWGPDGTQLGTTGSDESLCVWDFLGSKNIKKPSKRSSPDFGMCIR